MNIYISLIITMVFSAFFSGVEIAFVSVDKLRFEMERKENNLQNQSQSGLECFCHSAYCLLCGSLSHLQISLRLVLYLPSPLWNEG